MQFVDEAKIYIESGKGGDGCLSFRRERFIPRGGPDGGDGGRGGSVIFHTVNNLNTLVDYRFTQHFKAQSGEPGKGRNRHGAGGNNLILNVPIGTQIFDEETETLLADLVEDGQEVIIAGGGKGGLGNSRFKSSTNQAPRKTTKGEPAQKLTLRLQLKLISDAGLVGLPNAGKSTFLATTTRAKAKIADYPFTTLRPQLGVVYIDEKEFVLSDLPGLISQASQGKGLGDKFLKHVERCGIIIHLIAGDAEDVVENYKIIRGELDNYQIDLKGKKEIVVLTKIDALLDEEIAEKKQELSDFLGKKAKIFTISSVAKIGLDELLRFVIRNI